MFKMKSFKARHIHFVRGNLHVNPLCSNIKIVGYHNFPRQKR